MIEVEQINNNEKLRNILKGDDRSVPRSVALAMLPISVFPNKEEELRSVLDSSNESDSIRHVAATSLGKIDTPKAKEILIKSTESVKGDVLASVVIAMARYGDKRSLDAISILKDHVTGFVKLQAAFAAALISHRLGLEGHELPPPEQKGFLDVPDDSQEIIVEKADSHELTVCLQSIGQRPFGVELSEKPAYQFNHGKNSIILVNRDYAVPASIKALLERKAILGIVAEKNAESGRYFVSYLILTSPKKENNEINIWFARSHGKISFGGTSKIEDGEIKFSIRSISEIGVCPIKVEGSIRNNGFELKVARFSSIIPIRNHLTKKR
jgi:hypothetical protein